MPTSLTYLDAQVTDWLLKRLPGDAAILDVGPGAGKWGKILRPSWPAVDALEIHKPYVSKYDLQSIYRSVRVGDVCAWPMDGARYDLAFFGDVLEHLSAKDGMAVVEMLHAMNIVVLAIVPYNWKQGAIDGVAAERHLQADLNDEAMAVRYPCLRRLFYARHGREQFGAFVSKASALPRAPSWLEDAQP